MNDQYSRSLFYKILCVHDVCTGTSATVHVEARGQLCGVDSLLSPYVRSRLELGSPLGMTRAFICCAILKT